MKDVLAELFASKKFTVMLAGGIATVLIRVAGHFHIALDADSAKQAADALSLLVASYCVGQGLADHGATAAQIHADSVAAPVALPVFDLTHTNDTTTPGGSK